MGNILFIKGFSQYEAMGNYIDEIELGFRLLGYNSCVINAKEDSYAFQLSELAKSQKIDAVFTCGIMLIDICAKYFPEAYYITYLCDHPAWLREELEELGEKSIVFTCDKRHEAYVKRYCPNIKYVKYIPLSGSFFPKYQTYKERVRDIVFTGSYNRPETMYGKIAKYDGVLRMFAEHMTESIVAHPEQDLEKCLENTLEFFGVMMSEQEFHELAREFYVVDRYARSYYRDKMIRSLLESGLQVHVFGNGWEEFEGEGKENLIIEKGNFYVARKAVANAKIAINIMPWFKDGFQERIATAMLSGTVAVTDESKYILDNFTDGRELIIYSLNALEKLPVKVKWLLEHPVEAEKIALAGKDRAEQTLTWQHRACEMAQYVQQCVGLRPNSEEEQGEILRITYQTLHNREVALETIHSMNEIVDMIAEVQMYDKMDVYDVEYFYAKFLSQFMMSKANYPELCGSANIYNFLMNLSEEQAEFGTELLVKECRDILSVFLNMEREQLVKEKNVLRRQLAQMNTSPNAHSQEVLIKKLKLNYQQSQDEDIQEILANIGESNYVGPYNQNFINRYQGGIANIIETVGYDAQVALYYALWNGKKMYYPRDYTKEDVAWAIRFVHLEQDVKSPHRYLDDTFDVGEGDIVIDAGVAEGNFALDIVERAKKVYLVECEHKWIEALHKTFEPWKEKVVIIEKMLGDKDDAQFASIDGFVEEGYANFIKMDVEGAEVSALIGASTVLKNSKNIKCAICAYHRKNAEKDIRRMLEENHFYTTTTKGYMFFKEDIDSWVDGELRHGLVRAVK